HVPLSYRRVVQWRPLPSRILSWVREAGEGGAGKETVAVDVTLLDEQGEPLVEIERFVLKRIDAAAAFQRPAAARAGARVEAAAAAATAAGTGTASTEGAATTEAAAALEAVAGTDAAAPDTAVAAEAGAAASGPA